MIQPYPGSAQMPEAHRPPAPAPVLTAVKLMYAGAVASLAYMVIDLATLSTTKSNFEKRFTNLTAGTGGAAGRAGALGPGLAAGAIIGGVIAAALWLLMARACRNGKSWAQPAATVLFGIATLELLVGALVAPYAVPVKIISVVVWLTGLATTALLWRREATAFFKGTRP